MRSQNAAIYRWACKAVAIGHPFCSLTLILLLVIVSLFACTMMEAQSLAESNARKVGGPAESSSTNRSAVQDEHWNMSAAQKDASSEAGTHQVDGDRQDGWIHSWLRAVDTARASQPHFVAPIVTTHVMLVQQYRYDMSWQQASPGHTVTSNYGVSRGLEIIPTTRFEVGVSPPNYVAHQSNQKDGIGDLAWQVKFRAFSAPEHKGDYFVGFFMGAHFRLATAPMARSTLF